MLLHANRETSGKILRTQEKKKKRSSSITPQSIFDAFPRDGKRFFFLNEFHFSPVVPPPTRLQWDPKSWDLEGSIHLPNQQRTLNKLPTELRCRNFVIRHRMTIQIGAKRAKTCMQCVHIPTELPFWKPLFVVGWACDTRAQLKGASKI